MKNWFSQHITPLLIVIISVISPVIPLILTVGILVMTDFIFAIYKAFKLNEEITSRKMSNTITKMTLYSLAVISVFFIEKYVLDFIIPASKIASGLICFIELKSIDESFKKIFNWSLWDKMKIIISRGDSSTKDILKDLEDGK